MIKQRAYNEKGEKAPQQERKPYAKPHLKEYGHIEKLTQGGGATKPDAGTGRKA